MRKIPEMCSDINRYEKLKNYHNPRLSPGFYSSRAANVSEYDKELYKLEFLRSLDRRDHVNPNHSHY